MNYKVKVPPTSEMGSYTTTARRCHMQTLAQNALQDYNSAREHDGLPKVSRMPAGTIYLPIVEYVLQGHYSEGWEDLTAEETRKEAKEQLKCYRENEGGRYRIVRRAA